MCEGKGRGGKVNKKNKEAKKNWVVPTSTISLAMTEGAEQTNSTEKDEIENVRSLLRKMCKSIKKFEKIFTKIDKNKSGKLDQKEFIVLIKLCLRGDNGAANGVTQNVFKAVWVDLCNNEDEVDCSTANEWIFEEKNSES